LNRDGAYFTVNLSFGSPGETCQAVDNPSSPASNSALPTAENASRFAPPYKDKKTPNGLKDQKTHHGERTGSCGRDWEAGENRPPKLEDIRPDDLGDSRRLLRLYTQAVAQGLVNTSEAG